jgi:hypothetical protein
MVKDACPVAVIQPSFLLTDIAALVAQAISIKPNTKIKMLINTKRFIVLSSFFCLNNSSLAVFKNTNLQLCHPA